MHVGSLYSYFDHQLGAVVHGLKMIQQDLISLEYCLAIDSNHFVNAWKKEKQANFRCIDNVRQCV